jgi:hypothetical protein
MRSAARLTTRAHAARHCAPCLDVCLGGASTQLPPIHASHQSTASRWKRKRCSPPSPSLPAPLREHQPRQRISGASSAHRLLMCWRRRSEPESAAVVVFPSSAPPRGQNTSSAALHRRPPRLRFAAIRCVPVECLLLSLRRRLSSSTGASRLGRPPANHAPASRPLSITTRFRASHFRRRCARSSAQSKLPSARSACSVRRPPRLLAPLVAACSRPPLCSAIPGGPSHDLTTPGAYTGVSTAWPDERDPKNLVANRPGVFNPS